MGMSERADAEAESLEADLMNGDITQTEFNRYIHELGEEMREYEQNNF